MTGSSAEFMERGAPLNYGSPFRGFAKGVIDKFELTERWADFEKLCFVASLWGSILVPTVRSIFGPFWHPKNASKMYPKLELVIQDWIWPK